MLTFFDFSFVQITVPRDAGTCTRCPIECRLQSFAGSWSCKISVRYEFDAAGKPLDDISETAFGEVITEKADIEPALRRAQFAVLNPHISIDKILPMSIPALNVISSVPNGKALKFSRNVVCVDIRGPGLTDLSFIDLPGEFRAFYNVMA